jgi:hypothetical protein
MCRLRSSIVPESRQHYPEVVHNVGDIGMVWAKVLFQDTQSALERRLRSGIVPESRQHCPEVVQSHGNIGMVRAKVPFPDA